MAQINNLGAHTKGGTIDAGQNQKEVTATDLFNLICDATQNPTPITITGSPHVPSMDSFLETYVFILTGTPGNFIFELPIDGTNPPAHSFIIRNKTDGICTVQKSGWTSEVQAIVQVGETALISYDNTDATLELSGGGASAGIGKKTLWIPAGSMIPRITNPCSDLTQIELATNDVNFAYLAFATGTEEHAQFQLTLPKSWNLGTLTFEPFWSHAGGQTGGLDGVSWALRAVGIASDGAMDTAFGTHQVSALDGVTADDIFKGPESPAMTVLGTLTDDMEIFFDLFRKIDEAADDLDIDARFHGLKLYYTTDVGTDD